MAVKLSQSSNFANTTMVANITYRDIGTYGISIIIGVLLFMTPLFQWNWLAMLSYVFFASILVGRTPTKRTILLNLYNILLKKKVRMAVTELSTVTTIGHGIKEVIFDRDLGMPAFKMYDGHVCYVFNITSGINRWSDSNAYHEQALGIKKIFNVFEPGEQLFIVTKNDQDTGMLRLEDVLRRRSNFKRENNDDLVAMEERRLQLLHRVATWTDGRSVQQYGILKIKYKNLSRCYKALKNACRIVRPATNPGDIMLSMMGLEGGTEKMYLDPEHARIDNDADFEKTQNEFKEQLQAKKESEKRIMEGDES